MALKLFSNRVLSKVFALGCLSILLYGTGVGQQTNQLNIVKEFAPAVIKKGFTDAAPLSLRVDGKNVQFTSGGPGILVAKTADYEATVSYIYDKQYDGLSYQLSLKNTGPQLIRHIEYRPFQTKTTVSETQTPRVRYLTGGYHYDATYPSRAYQLYDYSFLTNDHSKPVQIGDDGMGSSYGYVPMLQYALSSAGRLSGYMVGFEWSGRWNMEAGWDHIAFDNSRGSDFSVSGTVNLGEFMLPPNQSIHFPKVHVVFFEGDNWTVLENKQKKYIAEKVGYKNRGKANINKVTYDHWFGLHNNFNMEVMMKEAARAAELGVEYFCLDASWYGRGHFGSSNTGKWDEPDPAKFPGGISDVKKLSDFLASKGIGFGIWHEMDTRNGGAAPVDYANPHDRNEALQTLRTWIKQWNLTWMRWEMTTGGVAENRKGIAYWNGYYEVMDAVLKEFPDLIIECCFGGGRRFDLAMASRTTSVWLSDHTADPNVVRYTQTGALRFWPSYFLNMAVRVHQNSGDKEAYAFNVISRMPGTLSFNGDIAQWSDKATKEVKSLVDKFKEVRHLQAQEAYFPLPQPRNMEDWDAVCYGDGSTQEQLLYVFRMEGADNIYIELPGKKSGWKLVMQSAAGATIKPEGKGYRVTIPRNSAIVWKR